MLQGTYPFRCALLFFVLFFFFIAAILTFQVIADMHCDAINISDLSHDSDQDWNTCDV